MHLHPPTFCARRRTRGALRLTTRDAQFTFDPKSRRNTSLPILRVFLLRGDQSARRRLGGIVSIGALL